MQTIIVTGGAGFIGGNFVHHLLTKEAIQVVNLDALTYAGNLDTLQTIMEDPRHQFVEGQIQDRELITGLFERFRPTAIVNFAAESHVDRSIDGPAEFIDTNIGAPLTCWNAPGPTGLGCRRMRRRRFASCTSPRMRYTAPWVTKVCFTETTPYAPNSPYSASKAASDHLVRAWHHTYGLPVLTTNCSNNYGPYQFPEKLIPLFIQKALTGRRCRSMGMAVTFGIGSMWRITAVPSGGCSRRVGRVRSTTWAAITK